MPYYTEEQIKQARSIDLMTYLQTYEPTELVHVRGNTWCLREHDSLKLSNGKWFWWSRGFGGTSALDYLIKVKGLPFIEAMDILTDKSRDFQLETLRIFNWNNSNTERKLLLPEKCGTNLEVIRYLTGRGIDREIIRDCITAKLHMHATGQPMAKGSWAMPQDLKRGMRLGSSRKAAVLESFIPLNQWWISYLSRR